MMNVPAVRGGLDLLAARSPLYLGIALLAMAVRHFAALGAFSMLHHLMAP